MKPMLECAKCYWGWVDTQSPEPVCPRCYRAYRQSQSRKGREVDHQDALRWCKLHGAIGQKVVR